MNIEIILIFMIMLLILVLAITFILIRRKKQPKIKSLESGSLFDSYEIIRFIKRGGMATVFEAFNVKTGDTVALKIMHESLMDDDDLVDKFLREGDILEKLNRKYPDAPIVKVFRHSRENNARSGRPFIALELVEGIDLDTYLLNNKPSIPQSLTIIRNILLALKVAHSEGILHRDISPGNIMVNFSNGDLTQVKMIDFGVAKNEYMNKNTPDSSIHGKPPFMSPEQCRNEKLDKRSDIYSLGILFYTILVGQPPFISKNPLEVMSMHQTNEYPPLPEGISKSIRNIIKNLLEKEIIFRYQSAEEVLSDLEKEELLEVNEQIKVSNTNNNSISKHIENVSDVFKISDKILPDRNSERKPFLKYLFIPALVIVLFIVGYIAIAELDSVPDKIILTKNEPIEKVLTQLREVDAKINYIFVNPDKSTILGNGRIMKTMIIDTKNINNDDYITIYIGNK